VSIFVHKICIMMLTAFLTLAYQISKSFGIEQSKRQTRPRKSVLKRKRRLKSKCYCNVYSRCMLLACFTNQHLVISGLRKQKRLKN